MAVKEFKGKIFYPVLYEGDAAAALESASVVNSKQKAVPVFREINMHCEEMRRGLGGMLGGDAAPGRIARVLRLRARRCSASRSAAGMRRFIRALAAR